MKDDAKLPPWFGQLQDSLLEGVEGIVGKKMELVHKDIEQIKNQLNRSGPKRGVLKSWPYRQIHLSRNFARRLTLNLKVCSLQAVRE